MECVNHYFNRKITFDHIIQLIRQKNIEREDKYVTRQKIYNQVVNGELTFLNCNNEVRYIFISP
jgi:hypothetical protein